MAETYDWTQTCTGSREDKERFHRVAKRLLRVLAREMGFEAGSFDIRSNMGGPAVSGEVTLHHNDVYIQVSSPGARTETGLMIRTCKNRQDYTGGNNHFAPLPWLDDAQRPKLRKLVEQVIEQKLGFNADIKNDPSYNPHYSTPRFSK
ncbi:hypothetical protein GOB57_09635 [Sinorhizobium meliloti]|nr:hypothetical protein [Sinorhizobium meliloti]